VYQEDTPSRVSSIIPFIQLLISIPPSSHTTPWVTAASIAKGCEGRRTPLLILDLARYPSVEELAGLLPAVCLYTPDDLRHVLDRTEVKAS
jgi:glutamyl-tRNA reductase